MIKIHNFRIFDRLEMSSDTRRGPRQELTSWKGTNDTVEFSKQISVLIAIIWGRFIGLGRLYAVIQKFEKEVDSSSKTTQVIGS